MNETEIEDYELDSDSEILDSITCPNCDNDTFKVYRIPYGSEVALLKCTECNHEIRTL